MFIFFFKFLHIIEFKQEVQSNIVELQLLHVKLETLAVVFPYVPVLLIQSAKHYVKSFFRNFVVDETLHY